MRCIAQLFAASLLALLNACGSGDEETPKGTAQGGQAGSGGSGGTAACPTVALDPNLEWASEPFATRITSMAGTFMVQGTAAMESARAAVEIQLTGGNTFLGGDCKYARVPAKVRFNIRPASGMSVVTPDFIPIAFKVYTGARGTAAGAEATFSAVMKTASITFAPDDGQRVVFRTFVLGTDLYVLTATP